MFIVLPFLNYFIDIHDIGLYVKLTWNSIIRRNTGETENILTENAILEKQEG